MTKRSSSWLGAIGVIDGLYAEIEELVNREILLQAPVASDLRFLLSVLRIVPELERSHDLVVEIGQLCARPKTVAVRPMAAPIGGSARLARGWIKYAA